MTMLQEHRKGITPVIAIVLLLMMTVAASGGAYLWITQLQEQFQTQAEGQLNRDISLVAVECYNKGGSGYVKAFMKNSGKTALDLKPVDMLVYRSGNIEADLSRTEISLLGVSLSPNINVTSGTDFADAGSSAQYEIQLSSGRTFNTNSFYNVEFVFTDEDDTEVSQRCEAEQR